MYEDALIFVIIIKDTVRFRRPGLVERVSQNRDYSLLQRKVLRTVTLQIF